MSAPCHGHDHCDGAGIGASAATGKGIGIRHKKREKSMRLEMKRKKRRANGRENTTSHGRRWEFGPLGVDAQLVLGVKEDEAVFDQALLLGVGPLDPVGVENVQIGEAL